MASIQGFVDNSSQLAHYELVDTIKEFAEDEGWTVLRFVQDSAYHEVILKGSGFTVDDKVYVGFKTYHDAALDYYNVKCAVFTGYVSGNTFETQPGIMLKSFCAHNQRIDYWITLNSRTIAGACKIGTPVYESFYVGAFYAYAKPTQYPYPVACGGTMNLTPAQRFSVATGSTHQYPYAGNRTQLAIRMNTGVLLQPLTHPWGNANVAGATRQIRPLDGNYPLEPIVVYDANGIYGELSFVFQVTGFNNLVENVLDGGDYVVIQNVTANGFNDYYALKMEL